MPERRANGRAKHGALAALSVFAAVGVGACLTPTQVTLHLTTNAHCAGATVEGDKFEEADVVAGRKVDASLSTQGHVDRCPESDRDLNELGTLVLQPLVDEEQVEVVIVAAVQPLVGQTLDKGQCLSRELSHTMVEGDPCIVARRRVGFVSHVKLDLEVELDTRCTGRVCEQGSTCYAGACVSEDSFCDASSPNCRLGVEAGATGAGTSASTGAGQGAAGGMGSVGGMGGMSASASAGSAQGGASTVSSVSSSVTSSSVSASSLAGAGGGAARASSSAASSASSGNGGTGGGSSSSSASSSASSGNGGTGGGSSSSGAGTCIAPVYGTPAECLANCQTSCMTTCMKNGVCVANVCTCP